MNHTLRIVSGIVACVTSLSGAVEAATILEFDFQNYDSLNHQVTASDVRSGASGLGQLLSTNGTTSGSIFATVDTGEALGTSGFQPQLLDGYLDVPRVLGSADGMGLTMTGAGSAWSDYAGADSYGTGTVAMAFQPYFNGNQAIRYTFFSHRVQDSGREIWFLNSGTSLLFRFKNATFPDFFLPAPVWSSNSWYFLAVSWAVGEEPSMYWREMKNGGGIIDPNGSGNFAINTSNLTEGTSFASPVYLGVRGNAFTTPSENMNGKMAYFSWTDQYTGTQSGFDYLYAVVVPEPSSLFLLSITGAIVWLARNASRRR